MISVELTILNPLQMHIFKKKHIGYDVLLITENQYINPCPLML